jgi:acyl carrier protein
VSAVRNVVVCDRLREIVASVLEMDLEDVRLDACLYEDLGADSLEKVAIVAQIESHFSVLLSAEEAAAVHSVKDAMTLLRAKGVVRTQADLVERLVGAHLSAGHGDRIYSIDPDIGEVSYARLHQAARGYAGALEANGVPAGTRGLIVADDSVASVVAILGLWWYGCVPVPVSPMLTDSEIRFVAGDCAAGIVHLDVAPPKQRALETEFGSLIQLTGGQVIEALRSGADTAAYRPNDAPSVSTWPADREALVQYTSGSTGTPKGVMHAATGLDAMLDGFGGIFGLRPDDIVLSTAKMSFGYGFGSSVLCPLAAGAGAILLRGSVDVHLVSAALRRHRPTVLCSVPRMYAALLDRVEREGASAFSSLRLCVSAGERCPARLSERVRNTIGVEFMNCLGATEVMHIAVATPPSQSMPGSIGFPVPGVTATVRNENGIPVPDGVEGRLHIAGPTVALGYLNRSEETSAAFADQGAYTNDIVRRTVNGDIQHVCRTDDILNLGGYKVAPCEIEGVVRETDGVADCVVVGGADENGLEHAVVYAVPEADVDHARIRRAVLVSIRTKLAAFKRPARVEFLDALPVTSTGKLATYKLRERVMRP